jgi:hypothetical protein
MLMEANDFGSFLAIVPTGWTVGSDDELIAVHPPDGDSYIQVSIYRGPDGHVPSSEELWDFAEESLEASWGVMASSIRSADGGFALDAEGPTDVGGAVVAFRLWPGRLLFATFYHSSESARYAGDARAFMASLRANAS